jgi:multimeric flavodoxin WrbA
MRILTIQGSPRKHGNTAAGLDAFEKAAGLQAEIERINVIEGRVLGCLGCDFCQADPAEPGCVQEDGMAEILERMRGADLVVYAAPAYCWEFPSQLKAVLDRHYCLVKWESGNAARIFAPKRAALLLTCGGPEAGNADLVQVAFRREMDYLGWATDGVYVVDNCTTPDALGPRAGLAAEEMVRDLLGSGA